MGEHKRKDVSRRIARIHGHVHGISEMLDEGRPYSEIVHQISAVRSSLDSVIVLSSTTWWRTVWEEPRRRNRRPRAWKS